MVTANDVLNTLDESKLTASKMVKLMKDRKEWGDMGDQVYVKKGNLIVFDSYYYGGDKALKQLMDDWSQGGTYYNYWNEKHGVIPKIVDTFTEVHASGRHKKLSDDGIVGIELKIN